MGTVTLSDDLMHELRELPNDALRCVTAHAWAAMDGVEDAGWSQDGSAWNLLGALIGPLDEEVERRNDLQVHARIEVEFNGHLAGFGGDGCTCGWEPERGEGHDVAAQCVEHAEANGGRSMLASDVGFDEKLFGQLWPAAIPSVEEFPPVDP